MVEDVSAQDAALFLNQQVLASEDTLQEYHVQDHGGCEVFPPVKAHEFVALARDQRDAEPLDGLAGQQRDVCPAIHEQHHVGDRHPA